MIGSFLREIGSIIADFFKKEEAWLVIIFFILSGGFLFTFPKLDINLDFGVFLRFLERFISASWWFWVSFLLFPTLNSALIHWRQEKFKADLSFVLLELKIPREIKKSPQAMEQVLAAFHSLRNAPGDIKEKYYEGEITTWFSLEMVSFGGEIKFFIRVIKKQRNLVEAALFSYYPDVEIVLVDDYTKKFPQSMVEVYRQKKDIWGTEMILTKSSIYPIKTYPFFESEAEEKQFDPISSFLEILGKISKDEIVGIQINIAPAGADWREKFEEDLNNLRKPSTTVLKSEEGAERETTVARTPGELDVLDAVEKNLSKQAFNALIRFVYLSPKETFYDSFARRGLVGAFNQYAALNLNSFRQNSPMSTRTQIWSWPHIFPKKRNQYRKQRILYNYLRREMPPETWFGRIITSYLFNWNFYSKQFKLNIEGLATLCHPPTAIVLTAPHIERLVSKKTGPPAGLAIFGSEDEVEKYYAK